MVFILIYLRLKAKLTSVINFRSDKEKSSSTLSHIQLGIKYLSEDVAINGSMYSITWHKNIIPGKALSSRSFSSPVSLVLHRMICIFREISCLQWAPRKTWINCFLSLFSWLYEAKSIRGSSQSLMKQRQQQLTRCKPWVRISPSLVVLAYVSD